MSKNRKNDVSYGSSPSGRFASWPMPGTPWKSKKQKANTGPGGTGSTASTSESGRYAQFGGRDFWGDGGGGGATGSSGPTGPSGNECDYAYRAYQHILQARTLLNQAAQTNGRCKNIWQSILYKQMRSLVKVVIDAYTRCCK
jgi:hypothetical protein